jgi:hypothetical protein
MSKIYNNNNNNNNNNEIDRENDKNITFKPAKFD